MTYVPGIDPAALDRYITGNYGEDQFRDGGWCEKCSNFKYIGDDEGYAVYQCKDCGDITECDCGKGAYCPQYGDKF